MRQIGNKGLFQIYVFSRNCLQSQYWDYHFEVKITDLFFFYQSQHLHVKLDLVRKLYLPVKNLKLLRIQSSFR